MSANNLVSHKFNSTQVGSGSGKRHNQQAISTAQGNHVAKKGAARQRGSIQAGQMAKTHELDNPLNAFIDAGTKLFSMYGDHKEKEAEAIRAEDANEVQLRYKAFKAEEKRRIAELPEDKKLDKIERLSVSRKVRSEYFSNVRHKGLLSKLDQQLDLEVSDETNGEQWTAFHTARLSRTQALVIDELERGSDLETLQQRFVTSGELNGDLVSQKELDSMLLKLYQTDKRNPALAEAIEKSATIPEEAKFAIRTEQAGIISVDSALAVERAVSRGDVNYLRSVESEIIRRKHFTEKEWANKLHQAEAQANKKTAKSAYYSIIKATGSSEVAEFNIGKDLTETERVELVNKAYTEGDEAYKQKMLRNSLSPVPIVKQKIAIQLGYPLKDGKLSPTGLQGIVELANVIQVKGGIGNSIEYLPEDLKPYAGLLAERASVVGEKDAIEQVLLIKAGVLPKPKEVSDTEIHKKIQSKLVGSNSWMPFGDHDRYYDDPEIRTYAFNSLKMYMQNGSSDMDKAMELINKEIESKYGLIEGENQKFVIKDLKSIEGSFNQLVGGRVKDKGLGDFLESSLNQALPDFKKAFADDGLEPEELTIKRDPTDPDKLVIHLKQNPFYRQTITLKDMVDKVLEHEQWSTYYDVD